MALSPVIVIMIAMIKIKMMIISPLLSCRAAQHIWSKSLSSQKMDPSMGSISFLILISLLSLILKNCDVRLPWELRGWRLLWLFQASVLDPPGNNIFTQFHQVHEIAHVCHHYHQYLDVGAALCAFPKFKTIRPQRWVSFGTFWPPPIFRQVLLLWLWWGWRWCEGNGYWQW